MSTDEFQQILLNDLNPDFLESVVIGAEWAYSDLYARLAENPALPDCVKEEEFNRQRSGAIMYVMARAAKQHGVPFEFMRLDCNGQHKVIIKSGRVILIQEPIYSLMDEPSPADYKSNLASVNCFVRQLELDLRDRPRAIVDWSGGVLAVLLHGAAGGGFSERQSALGGLMLAMPDADYRHWISRLDVRNLAVTEERRRADKSGAFGSTQSQPDNVIVTTRKKGSGRSTG